MKKNQKLTHRLLSVAMSGALLMTLASCSEKKTTYGDIDFKDVFAESGSYSINKAELWNELQWSTSDILTSQIDNVILNEYIQKLNLVVNKKYDDIKNNKESMDLLKIEDQDGFNTLYDKYTARLEDYVIADIYNLNYSTSDYDDAVEDLDDKTKYTSKVQYIDEMYSTYRLDLKDLVFGGETNKENYLTIAKKVSELYFPQVAKELLAYDKIDEEAQEKIEDAKEDGKEDYLTAYFDETDYASQFKKRYQHTYDINLVLIRFSSSTEFDDTLRAFGIKAYNKNLYYVGDENATDTDGDGKISFQEYSDYYKDLTSSELTRNFPNITQNYSESVLEIYVQIYNYMYGGYRQILPSTLEANVQSYKAASLNDLRTITKTAMETVSDSKALANKLITEKSDIVTYTKDELDDLLLTTYCYDTLIISDNSDELCYSTSTQSYNDSQYIAYKFGNFDTTAKYPEETQNTLYQTEIITALKSNEGLSEILEKRIADLSNDDIWTIITALNSVESSKVYSTLYDELVQGTISEANMKTYMTEAAEDVKVKIYNEATEISYSNSNSDYSKTHGKNKNKNVIATIKYDDKTWNLNIGSDADDENSLMVPGKDEAYGAFNYLLQTSGETTAIDLITNKMIKDTDAYTETNEDRDSYENYIDVILYNFANGGYDSSGYASTIGKYNFLMLYFHSSDVDEIIDNYYRVQYASAKLLNDYADDDLIKFFNEYTDSLYENYFGMNGNRVVVFFDGDDDGQADDTENTADNWINKEVEFDLNDDGIIEDNEKNVKLSVVAKELIYEIYIEACASTESHFDKLDAIVSEIKATAHIEFDPTNPILAENQWARYRHVGLNVSLKEFTVSNDSVDCDFALKQRLYDYSNGYSADKTKVYQYYIGENTPQEYMEPWTEYTYADSIVMTQDGFNLILVTSANAKTSAKFSKEDHPDNLLTNIYLIYNDDENPVCISDIYNETDKLNANQIKLYILDYVTSSSSTLIPEDISTSVTTFLKPVFERYTNSSTQRIILSNYIGKVTFKNGGSSEYLEKIYAINERTLDSYNEIYTTTTTELGDKYYDVTGTSNTYKTWWDDVNTYIATKTAKEAK